MHFLDVTIDNDGRVTVDTCGMSYEQLLSVVLTVDVVFISGNRVAQTSIHALARARVPGEVAAAAIAGPGRLRPPPPPAPRPGPKLFFSVILTLHSTFCLDRTAQRRPRSRAKR